MIDYVALTIFAIIFCFAALGYILYTIYNYKNKSDYIELE